MKVGEEGKPQSASADSRTDLQQASELVSSLISSSYSLRSFPVKWRLIREKLEQLNSGLAVAAAGGIETGCSSTLAKLLQAIVSTIDEAQALVHHCCHESYSGGKLQMRSDLDVIASKIDLHLKRLTEICNSGILADTQSIIVSRPGAGASREDMRFYINDLFSRLRIGDSEMRAGAMVALNEALSDDDKYARIAALEVDNGISLLVRFLELKDARIQEEAAEAIAMIAGFDSYKGALVTTGVISSLVRVLETGSQLGKARAARALRRLTENSDNAWSFSAHGGVTALLQICGDGNSTGELVGSACRILRNLSSVGEIKRFMLDEGAVLVFMKILRESSEEASQIQAIDSLYTIASDDDNIKQKVIEEGVIEPLVQILDPNSCHSLKARGVALSAIEVFCFSASNAMKELISCGFLDRIHFFLKNGEVSTQELALKTAFRLCGISSEIKKLMGDMRFIPVLINLLESKSFDIREMAAEVLCSLVSVQRNRRRFIQEDYNINQVLQLISAEEEKSVTNKSLLSVLMSLTESNSGRRKIVASGYMKNLEKLAETDALDAKKIVKKLSSKKVWNIFSGLWSL